VGSLLVANIVITLKTHNYISLEIGLIWTKLGRSGKSDPLEFSTVSPVISISGIKKRHQNVSESRFIIIITIIIIIIKKFIISSHLFR